jgi:hypothetical protein
MVQIVIKASIMPLVYSGKLPGHAPLTPRTIRSLDASQDSRHLDATGMTQPALQSAERRRNMLHGAMLGSAESARNRPDARKEQD